jgi:DUF4097 and DUF4098 domain-containing protein YvlB
MKKSIFCFLSILLVLKVSSLYPASGENPSSKTFPAKKVVEINTSSGDCIIKGGAVDKITVDLEVKVEPADAFNPEFLERADRLIINEKWYGRSHGSVIWKITVPVKTEIELETASGDISLEGLTSDVEIQTASGDVTVEQYKGGLELETASGDIILTGCEGEFEISSASGDINISRIEGNIELSSASGDIDIEDSQGGFELETASGDIQAIRLDMQSASEFSAASGDIEIVLSNSPANSLSLSSASGDIILDYNGNPLKGRFEFTTRRHRGEIDAPVTFDKEETSEAHGKEYVKKTFTASGNEPLITLETVSGQITLRK